MREFENDPFFSGFGSHRDMFESMGRLHDPFMAISDGQDDKRRTHKDRGQAGQVADPFSGMFQSMNSMMSGMHRHMADLQAKADCNDPNVHSFSSSTVMSYRNDGKSEPKYFEASSSTRRAPGNVKETRRTLRDSEFGIDKMAVGHHIGEKGRVVERRRYKNAGGAIEEEKNYFHMGEDDEQEFDKEWRNRTSTYNSDYGRLARGLAAPKAMNRGRPARGLAAPEEAVGPTREPSKRVRVKDNFAVAARGHEQARPHGPSKSGRTRSKY